MTSRERVLRAIEFGFPDRVPRNLWPLPWVDMFWPEELASVQRDYPDDLLGVEGVLAPGNRCSGTPYRRGTHVDAWGAVWASGEDGVLGEVKGAPLANWSALDTYQPPWEIIRGANWDAANRLAEDNQSGENKFLYAWTDAQPFERMQRLRGTEELLIDLACGDANLQLLLRMVHEFNLEAVTAWAKTDLDALLVHDDWGSQQALLISPEMWREIFKPIYREYCDIIRGAGKKVLFHSDGYITDIFEDLIEIGVDAVNSQLFCMDIEEIGRRFKGRITFWGEIDRQHVLPFGTVEQVRQAVRRVRLALEDPAGGMIAQCQWGPKNPPANIRTVYEAWQEPLSDVSGD